MALSRVLTEPAHSRSQSPALAAAARQVAASTLTAAEREAIAQRCSTVSRIADKQQGSSFPNTQVTVIITKNISSLKRVVQKLFAFGLIYFLLVKGFTSQSLELFSFSLATTENQASPPKRNPHTSHGLQEMAQSSPVRNLGKP